MSRELTVGEQNEMAAALNRPALLFKGVFDTTTLRLWTGNGDFTFNAETYLGNGWLVGVGVSSEVPDIRATGVKIDLSGVNATVVSVLLNESTHKGTGQLWLVMLDAAGALVGDGYLLFSGRLEAPEIEETGQGAKVTIGYESVLASLLRRRENRYTDQNQRLFYPADAGLQYVVQSQQWTGYWGRGENKLRLRRRDRR